MSAYKRVSEDLLEVGCPSTNACQHSSCFPLDVQCEFTDPSRKQTSSSQIKSVLFWSRQWFWYNERTVFPSALVGAQKTSSHSKHHKLVSWYLQSITWILGSIPSDVKVFSTRTTCALSLTTTYEQVLVHTPNILGDKMGLTGTHEKWSVFSTHEVKLLSVCRDLTHVDTSCIPGYRFMMSCAS
jgi:hypothetical protein